MLCLDCERGFEVSCPLSLSSTIWISNACYVGLRKVRNWESTTMNSKFLQTIVRKRGSCAAPGAACEEGGKDGRAAISDLLEAIPVVVHPCRCNCNCRITAATTHFRPCRFLSPQSQNSQKAAKGNLRSYGSSVQVYKQG